MFSILSISTFVPPPPAGSTYNSPDSITVTPDGDVWVAYTNGADSTGLFGTSTVIEYDQSGNIVPGQTYNIAGYVDGLKFNPSTGQIWALQNQDGNSTLTIINPATQSMSGPLKYGSGYVYGPTSGRGFDDVVFDGNEVFLSETNPPGPAGDPIIVELVNSNGNGLGKGSQRTLVTKTVLTDGTMGLNTETGTMQQVLITDPDSLKLASNGDLLLTGGDDGVIIDVKNPGSSNQTIEFTQVQGVPPGVHAGLDDVIRPDATSGTFYIADTTNNQILAVHVTGLNVNDYYASVASLGGFGQIDPTTGTFTLMVPISAPHGVEFVADGTNSIAQLGQVMASFAPAGANNSMPLTVVGGADQSQQPLLTTPQHV